jgi:F420H(2)-dependent quinone reductase
MRERLSRAVVDDEFDTGEVLFRASAVMVLVESLLQRATDADLRELRANRRAHIEVGAEWFDVTAHELSAGEREQMLPEVTAAVPAFAESQAKTKRVIPLFELQRV